MRMNANNARALKEKLEQEMNSLPEFNSFGDSNDESKKQSKEEIAELDYFISTKGEALAKSDSEIGKWLTGYSDIFNCYFLDN